MNTEKVYQPFKLFYKRRKKQHVQSSVSILGECLYGLRAPSLSATRMTQLETLREIFDRGHCHCHFSAELKYAIDSVREEFPSTG